MEEENQSIPQFAAPAPKRKINKRFIYLLAVILFLILAFIGYKIIGGSQNNSNLQNLSAPTPTIGLAPTDTPTPSSEETPTPSPKPDTTNTPTPKPSSNPVDKSSGLDRSDLSVTVENGSGQAGVAASGKDYLSGLGYNVTATSNADNFDYTGVTIQVKKTSSDFLALLKSDLSSKYTITSATSDLSSSSSTDAVVIIGK